MVEFSRVALRMAVIGRGSPFLVGSAVTLLATFAVRAAPPAGLPAPSAPAQAPAAQVDFARDVQPLLERHCYECHGTKKARGRLRLHSPGYITKGGESGAVVVARDTEQSLLMRRVLGLDGEDRMPLDADPLSDAELATLRGWIASGAVMPAAPAGSTAAADVAEHWAYVKPVRPALPAVSRQAWVRTPVDRFVLARLDHEKLSPSAEADRQTLLRRVTLDLTGLPPTPAEIDAFVADAQPGAYERVVDRLLASPRYGERWARPWLDLARYADTNGHEKDKRRDIWKYRDWVIDALNADMPFDRFTVEQIAGDMLPDATEAQRIATGFHRNAMTNEEGGVDPDESMYEVLVDRANTTSTVWLGTHAGLRAVPQPQVRSVQPEGLLPAPRVLRQPGLRDTVLGRRHALLRSEAGSGDAGAGGEADGAAGRDQAAGRRAGPDHARDRRAAARLGRRDPRRRSRLDGARAARRHGDQRRPPHRAAGWIDARVGPERRADDLHRHVRDEGARG